MFWPLKRPRNQTASHVDSPVLLTFKVVNSYENLAIVITHLLGHLLRNSEILMNPKLKLVCVINRISIAY
jgi:hypothetical protein